MALFKTHYDNLKVSRDAPPELIRAAYKTLSLKYHPDRNADSAEATRIMGIINAAYDVLSDPAKRKVHDLWITNMEAANHAKAQREHTAQEAANQAKPHRGHTAQVHPLHPTGSLIFKKLSNMASSAIYKGRC